MPPSPSPPRTSGLSRSSTQRGSLLPWGSLRMCGDSIRRARMRRRCFHSPPCARAPGRGPPEGGEAEAPIPDGDMSRFEVMPVPRRRKHLKRPKGLRLKHIASHCSSRVSHSCYQSIMCARAATAPSRSGFTIAQIRGITGVCPPSPAADIPSAPTAGTCITVTCMSERSPSAPACRSILPVLARSIRGDDRQAGAAQGGRYANGIKRGARWRAGDPARSRRPHGYITSNSTHVTSHSSIVIVAAIPLKAFGADERELTEFANSAVSTRDEAPRISPPKTSPAPIPVPALDSVGRLEPKQVRQVRHVH